MDRCRLPSTTPYRPSPSTFAWRSSIAPHSRGAFATIPPATLAKKSVEPSIQAGAAISFAAPLSSLCFPLPLPFEDLVPYQVPGLTDRHRAENHDRSKSAHFASKAPLGRLAVLPAWVLRRHRLARE